MLMVDPLVVSRAVPQKSVFRMQVPPAPCLLPLPRQDWHLLATDDSEVPPMRPLVS